MQYITIIEIPEGKMVSSDVGMFDDDNFNRFNQWFSLQKPQVANESRIYSYFFYFALLCNSGYILL